MSLSRKRLRELQAISAKNALWLNSSWSAWPAGDVPKWMADGQFTVARELVRLALIGAEHSISAHPRLEFQTDDAATVVHANEWYANGKRMQPGTYEFRRVGPTPAADEINF